MAQRHLEVQKDSLAQPQSSRYTVTVSHPSFRLQVGLSPASGYGRLLRQCLHHYHCDHHQHNACITLGTGHYDGRRAASGSLARLFNGWQQYMHHYEVTGMGVVIAAGCSAISNVCMQLLLPWKCIMQQPGGFFHGHPHTSVISHHLQGVSKAQTFQVHPSLVQKDSCFALHKHGIHPHIYHLYFCKWGVLQRFIFSQKVSISKQAYTGILHSLTCFQSPFLLVQVHAWALKTLQWGW